MRHPANRPLAILWPPILQVTIACDGKFTSAFDMRIPVPRGGEDEARALAESFDARRWGVPRSQAGAS